LHRATVTPENGRFGARFRVWGRGEQPARIGVVLNARTPIRAVRRWRSRPTVGSTGRSTPADARRPFTAPQTRKRASKRPFSGVTVAR